MRSLYLLIVGCWMPLILSAQPSSIIVDYLFHPDYQLPGNAANYPGPRVPLPQSRLDRIDIKSYPFLLKREEPTQRLVNLLDADKMPTGPFSIEMWMLNHVNQPIGALATIKSSNFGATPHWLLGYYGNEIVFSINEKDQDFPTLIDTKIERGWKKYWLHIVVTFDGQNVKLYYNGTLKKEMTISGIADLPASPELELAAYMNNEPYMELANLLKRFRLYNTALSTETITQNFQQFQQQVEKGILFPDQFHFSAGPYLHLVTPNSINLTWETDRKVSKAIIEYGEKLPLTQEVQVPAPGAPEVESTHFIQTYTLDGLKAATPYFYNIKLTDDSGATIESGVLTFATADSTANPFSFAILGDTEARPHVNHQVARLIWDERPNFIINLGDLTDGGKEPHKFEWNQEYFTGMTALTSRIPVFPVAGNGEGDLYWYKRYHQLPDPEGYYTFTYGDAQFFMLDSNQKDQFDEGGEQYQWLEEQLKASTATWKFVAHHHAPYSSDENDYGDSWKEASNLGDLRIRKIVPLYEKYGVDIVFFGHLHTYQRTLPILEQAIDQRNGVIYLQGGGGGGNLEDFTPTRSWFSAKTYRGHHYFTINIVGEELHMKMFDTEGRMRDFVTIEK